MKHKLAIIHTTDIKDFLGEIFPISRYAEDEYIYRGQSNSEWDLTPSLMRELEQTYPKASVINYELQIIMEFIRKIGRVNLSDSRIREAMLSLEKIFNSINKAISTNNKHLLQEIFWPERQILEILSIAQHSGLPTRLLDWSYNPFVAAFFAAYDISVQRGEKEIPEKISVWMMKKSSFKNGILNCGINGNSFHLVEPPYSGPNQNATAQSGCFTCFYEKLDSGCYSTTSIDEVFDKIEIEKPYHGEFFAKKITFPAKLYKQVLNQCEIAGISYSKLFRTYEGCAIEAKMTYNELHEHFGSTIGNQLLPILSRHN